MLVTFIACTAILVGHILQRLAGLNQNKFYKNKINDQDNTLLITNQIVVNHVSEIS